MFLQGRDYVIFHPPFQVAVYNFIDWLEKFIQDNYFLRTVCTFRGLDIVCEARQVKDRKGMGHWVTLYPSSLWNPRQITLPVCITFPRSICLKRIILTSTKHNKHYVRQMSSQSSTALVFHLYLKQSCQTGLSHSSWGDDWGLMRLSALPPYPAIECCNQKWNLSPWASWTLVFMGFAPIEFSSCQA